MHRSVSKAIPLAESDSEFRDESLNMKVVCVELAENAISLPEYTHHDKAFYIFGPEDGTISQEVINRADDVVYIPTVGCMNLAATVNVLLYDRLAKSKEQMSGETLIRNSRDINNRLKVTKKD
jgi:tRNA(Leu) C34 or U34 (ribose-2'-O)-methylase TrmL